MANYDINYDDSRFAKVEGEKKVALNEMEQTYSGMIEKSDKYYQQQIEASKQWADKQSQLQQDKTDFAIKEINQNKEQAKKDYIKEQQGAFVDWRKQSNQYGAESEQMASSGLANTGFSESSQVSMYNTYQNRVATARESYNLAIQNYNNAITEARLQNNSILAEIAYEALQKQLELSLQGFQYKNTLIVDKADKKMEINNEYYNRYQDVLKQINTENALAEEIRQYNESLAEEKRQFNEQMAFEKMQYADSQAKKSSGGGGRGGSSSSGGTVKGGSSGSSGGSDINKTSGDLPKETAQSILDLGKGPLSAKTVDRLVQDGYVAETTSKSGNTVFKQNSNLNTSTSYLASGKSVIPKKKEEKSWKNLWGLLD